MRSSSRLSMHVCWLLQMRPRRLTRSNCSGEQDNQLEMLLRLELPQAWHGPLQARASELGIAFLHGVRQQESEFLNTLDLASYKIASGESLMVPCSGKWLGPVGR